MSRRKKINKREIELDARYKDRIISKFLNVIMLDGKKTTAEKFAKIQTETSAAQPSKKTVDKKAAPAKKVEKKEVKK